MNEDNIRQNVTSIVLHPRLVSSVRKSFCSSSALHEASFIDLWIAAVIKKTTQKSMIIPLEDVDGWNKDQAGNINHESGRFFSVIGIHVRHRVDREELEWDQPIIEQPETGILGILCKSINGVMHFCLQAKEEPGNIGNIQMSPTVQATFSNYTGAHGGTTPIFLDLFINPEPENVLFSRLQTEDGGRFLYKSNRNMIVNITDDFSEEIPENFIWLTLGQIAELISRDNLVNACTRSILSGLLLLAKSKCDTQINTGKQQLENGIRGTLQWLDCRRAANHIQAKRIGLNDLKEWRIDEKGFFSHQEKRFFRIVGIKILCGKREVKSWGQPIVENPAPGIIGLLLRSTANGIELLMQAKAEVGNRSTVQLGPTVQFTQGNYEGSRKLKKPFLYDKFIKPQQEQIIHDSCQTEEGARFYREYHHHRILILSADTNLSLPVDYRWIPLSDVIFLLHFGEQVNSCARSILSCLP